jgi:3-deoxy-D-manno-octulosonic-acid transferase
MLYNLFLILYFIFIIPKVLYEYLLLKKKKKDLLKRLGLKKYSFNFSDKKPIIWVHAVSLGETKVATSLVEKLKKEYPNSYIIISNTTQTGHEEAKKSLLLADKFIFFPFDFPYSVKKVFSQVKPNIIIFIETDYWFNFIKEAKKNCAKVVLVSGKISEKSLNRFSKVLFFSKKLFSYFDLILTQDELYKKRFSKLISNDRLHISGNLKLVNNIKKYPKDFLNEWLSKLKAKNSSIITIASTHDPEEEMIIKQIKDIPNIKILLAPRHPERFNLVYKRIKKIISCCLLSNLSEDAKVIVIDRMGILNILYQISDLAIVGGSFINRVGGHNILEPVFVNTPVFFGPYMHTQIQLKKMVLDSNCGKEVNLEDLNENILKFLQNESSRKNFIDNCTNITKTSQNILEDTFQKIKKLI